MRRLIPIAFVLIAACAGVQADECPANSHPVDVWAGVLVCECDVGFARDEDGDCVVVPPSPPCDDQSPYSSDPETECSDKPPGEGL